MKSGIYIYGVIKTSEPQEFGGIGIGDKAPKVLTVGFKDLAAVVSKSPFMVYDSLAKEKTVKDLVTHQLVIENVMSQFTILPVKFGTMVETEGQVIKLLKKGLMLLRGELGRMEGKVELDVVASWQLPKILAAIYSSNRRVQKKQEEISKKDSKAATQDRVALGKLVERVLKSKRARCDWLILQTLKKKAEKICLHDLVSDEMIFNAAFLIKKADKAMFEKALDELDQRFEDTLNFRLVGPLPPYSFSTIIFKRMSQQEVEEAKKTLGLNGEITDKLINHAYRQLAQEYHPDKQASQNQLKFDLINSAYKILKDFTKRGFYDVDIYRWEEHR